MKEIVKPITLLLVEDDAQFGEMIDARLAEASGGEVTTKRVGSLGAAIEALGSGGGVDAVILDLMLPDCSGLDGIDRLREADADIPVIVLTGTKPEDLGLEAIRRGAQDYLVKASADGETVARTARYAIERQSIMVGMLRTIDHLRESDLELADSEAGSEPLATRNEGTHRNLAREYSALLESSLRPGLGSAERIKAGIEELARRLHEVNAGPRDLVEVHLTAISLLAPADRRGSNVIIEGQILLLELMGKTLERFKLETLRASD